MSMNSFHSRGRRPAPAPRPALPAPVRGGMVRADALLVQQGLVTSRTQARAMIATGRVRHGHETLGKAAQLLPPDTQLEIHPDAG